MKVSALTLIHNRADLLCDAVASVLSQSYPVHELIAIDDGSTEDVKAVLDSFNDARIKYYRYKHGQMISKLRNIALSKASGDVMAFIDSDDKWHPDKIKIHVEDLLATSCVISFSDCRLFDAKGWIGRPVCEDMNKQNTMFREMTERNQSIAFGSNLFFQRSIAGEEVKFDERLYSGEHDLVLMLCARYKSSYIDQVLNYIRRHDRNISSLSSSDIISPLEYNHTLDKLKRSGFMSDALYKRIKAGNYANVGLAYLKKKRYKKSRAFLMEALKHDAKWSYVKVLVKALIGLQ